jgi:hypothetical protein
MKLKRFMQSKRSLELISKSQALFFWSEEGTWVLAGVMC